MENPPAGRVRTVLVLVAVGLTYAAWIATVWFDLRFAYLIGDLTPSRVFDTVAWSGAFAGLPAVGALLAVKRPTNPVGWTILGAVGCLYLSTASGSTASYVVAVDGAIAGPALALIVATNALAPVTMVLLAHIVLLFPDGVLTRAGRRVSRAAITAGLLAAVTRLLRPGRLDVEAEVQNPLAWDRVPAGDTLVAPLTTFTILCGFVAVLLLIGRYRRSDATERKQFQWILASLAVFPVLLVFGGAVEAASPDIGNILVVLAFDVGFLGFAVSLYRAIMRHRLFEIDRVVSRTVSYALVTAILVGGYLLSVVAIQSVLRPVLGSSDLAVALSTLAVAASFQPLRRRVQTVVDRRFSRARYDAGRTVERFGARVRDEVDLPGLVGDLRRVSAETVQPEHVVVWLAPR